MRLRAALKVSVEDVRDHLAWIRTACVGLNSLRREGEHDSFVLGDGYRDFDAIPYLAVHLDHHRHHVHCREIRIELGPWSDNNGPGLPHAVPEFLCNVGCQR